MEDRNGVIGRDGSETFFSVVDSRESSGPSEYWDSVDVDEGAVSLGVTTFAVAEIGALAGNMDPKDEVSPPAGADDAVLPESQGAETEVKVKPNVEDESTGPAPTKEVVHKDPPVKSEEQAKRSRNSFSKKVSNLFSSFSKKDKGDGVPSEEKQDDSRGENPQAIKEQTPEIPQEEPQPKLAEGKEEGSCDQDLDAGEQGKEAAPEEVVADVNLEGTGIKAETKEMAPSPLEVHASCDKPTSDPEPTSVIETPQMDDVPASDSTKKTSLDEGLFFNSPAAIAAALTPSSEAVTGSQTRSQTRAEAAKDVSEQQDAAGIGSTPSTGEKKINDPTTQARRSGSFLEQIFGFGSRNSSRKEETAPTPQESTDDSVDVGYGLTKGNIVKMSERLDTALKEEGKSMASIFNRSFDEFSDPVEYFLEMEASFSADETAPGIIESLSLELGDEHPLVTELKRKHNLEQIEQVDAYVRESLEKKEKGLSESIFKEKPEEYETTAEYYVGLEKKASDMGHSLLPFLTDKLGETHPIVKVLSDAKPTLSEKPGENLQDEFVDVELTQTSTQELPVSEGGVLSGTGVGTNPESEKEGSKVVRDETDPPKGYCGGCICLRA